MNDINIHCDENIGGIFLFRFIPTIDVESIPEPINSRITEPITLKSGKRWFNFYATPGSMKFEEEVNNSSHGDYIKAKLTGNTPKGRIEVVSNFNKMLNQTFIIDYTDNNKFRKIVGTLTEPMRFKRIYTTGDKPNTKNSYSFEFYGDITQESPEYFI